MPKRVIAVVMFPIRWLRDRFTRAEIPVGWDLDTLEQIRPHFADTDQVIELVGDELGVWAPSLAEPARPLFFEATRELHPVDLQWRPAWLDWMAAA